MKTEKRTLRWLKYWKDDRLKFSAEHTTPRRRGKSSNIGEIKHASLKDKVWTPDPFFANQKEGKVLTNPADNTLFKILSTGKTISFYI